MPTVSLAEHLSKEILNHYFSGFTTLDNIRPEWAEGLEIDRFYPQLGVAIEFQGPQHYRHVSRMHSKKEFEAQLKADSKKRILADKSGYLLMDLTIRDFNRLAYKATVERIRRHGMGFARGKGDEDTLSSLKRMRIRDYPDHTVFRRLEGIIRKASFRPGSKGRKKSLFGIFNFQQH